MGTASESKNQEDQEAAAGQAKPTAETLALIPARSLSTSIKHKNLQEVGGIPLLGHAVLAARESKKITRIIVSTDSEEYQKIARDYGAETPFLRPSELAEEVPTELVVSHALAWLETRQHYTPERFVLIQPTTPLVTGEDIDKGLQKHDEYGKVVSVSEAAHPPAWAFTKTEQGYLKSLQAQDLWGDWGIRQSFGAVLYPNGGFYIAWVKDFLRKPCFIDSGTGYHLMPQDRGRDVDTLQDLEYLNYLANGRYSWLIQRRKHMLHEALLTPRRVGQ